MVKQNSSGMAINGCCLFQMVNLNKEWLSVRCCDVPLLNGHFCSKIIFLFCKETRLVHCESIVCMVIVFLKMWMYWELNVIWSSDNAAQSACCGIWRTLEVYPFQTSFHVIDVWICYAVLVPCIYCPTHKSKSCGVYAHVLCHTKPHSVSAV